MIELHFRCNTAQVLDQTERQAGHCSLNIASCRWLNRNSDPGNLILTWLLGLFLDQMDRGPDTHTHTHTHTHTSLHPIELYFRCNTVQVLDQTDPFIIYLSPSTHKQTPLLISNHETRFQNWAPVRISNPWNLILTWLLWLLAVFRSDGQRNTHIHTHIHHLTRLNCISEVTQFRF